MHHCGKWFLCRFRRVCMSWGVVLLHTFQRNIDIYYRCYARVVERLLTLLADFYGMNENNIWIWVKITFGPNFIHSVLYRMFIADHFMAGHSTSKKFGWTERDKIWGSSESWQNAILSCPVPFHYKTKGVPPCLTPFYIKSIFYLVFCM